MDTMDYIAFCKNYYAATRIPTNLLRGSEVLYSTMGNILSIPLYRMHEIDPSGLDFPCLNDYDPRLEYGMIQVEGTDLIIVIGPNFGIHPTHDIISEHMKEQMIPPESQEMITEFLYTVPQISLVQFVRHIILIHQCVNRKSCDLSHFFGEGYSEENAISTKEKIRPEYEQTDDQHSTYFYELDLCERVRKGNVAELKEYLSSIPLNTNTHHLAKTQLRQTKNQFIKTATNVVMIGAIPGGVPVDTAYALLEKYIQEVEALTSVRDIELLNYNMTIELCELSGRNKIPKGLSAEVFNCMSFIRSHTNEPISVEDVAEVIQRSPSYVTKSFRKELGITPGAFINRCKLEEAKSLLLFSEKSLAEISSHLCYSSQGYFQNVFKKQFGMTPMQYRKTKRRIE